VETQKRCVEARVKPPSRSTIGRRWVAHQQGQAAGSGYVATSLRVRVQV
jgi:hypothetical protein